ncbi:MAG: tetratricopeptide repeat protein [Gemmatimonadota bacterium]|nr:tetratricopeptide repeat protein [Gemmatimonadota bacterium]
MPWWSFLTGGRETDEVRPDYYAEGVQLANEERFHEALTSLRLALRERPGDVATLEQMAIVYTRMGMTDEAIKMYQRALEKDTDSAGAHYGIAFLYLSRGRGTDAMDHLEAFLRVGVGIPGSERHVEHAKRTLAELRGAPPAPHDD